MDSEEGPPRNFHWKGNLLDDLPDGEGTLTEFDYPDGNVIWQKQLSVYLRPVAHGGENRGTQLHSIIMREMT